MATAKHRAIDLLRRNKQIDQNCTADGTRYRARKPCVVHRRAEAQNVRDRERTNHDPSVRLRNDRIVAIPVAARREGDMSGVDALPRRVREECEQFAMVATALEGKDVRILGWDGPASALSLLHAAQADGHR